MKSFISLILIFSFCFSFAGKKTDSLEKMLSQVSGKEKLRVLKELTDIYIRHDRVKAWKYFDEFENLYFFLKEPLEMKGIYFHQKATRLMHDGDFEGSVLYFKKAEPVLMEQKDFIMLWNLYNGFGSAYQEHGDKEKSLYYFVKAFEVAEKNKDEGSMAGSAINLGVIYAETGDHREALKYFVLSKNYHEKGGGWGYGNCLNNIGQVYSLTGKKDSAQYYYTKALAVWERLKDEAGLAMSHFNLGELNLETKEFSSAEAHLLISLEISERINEQFGITQNLAVLSALYFAKGNKSKGLEYLDKSISFAKKNSMMNSLQENYFKLYNFHKKEKDFKNALWAHEEFFFWYDSLNNAEKNKNLQALYSKFETTKKQKEIEKQRAEISLKDLELQKRKSSQLLLFSGLIIALLTCGFIFINLHQNKKKNKVISEQKEEVIRQKIIIEEKALEVLNRQGEMLDSIHYAQKIQQALLTSNNLLERVFSDCFIIFKPRDIVSGDFYWAFESDLSLKKSREAKAESEKEKLISKQVYFAICDSTGHGVPGAFMSLLNISFLNQAIAEKNITDPAEVFNFVREMLIRSLGNIDEKGNVSEIGQDGMDGILFRFDLVFGGGTDSITYAASNNAALYVMEKTITELLYDKIPVGASPWQNKNFTSRNQKVKPGGRLYAFSDGYADQFGGPKIKKFKNKNLKNFIFSNSGISFSEQKELLLNNFENWRGDQKQIDDVLIAAIKI